MDLWASFSKLKPSASISLNLFKISLCLAISVDKIHLQSIVKTITHYKSNKIVSKCCGFHEQKEKMYIKMEISFSIDYGNAYLITPSRNFLKTSWPIFLKISQWGYKEYKMTNFKGRLFTRGLTQTVVLLNRLASSFLYKRVDWIK